MRDDEASAHYVFQLPVTTYQAYNFWGGKSLYGNSSGAQLPWGSSPGTAAVKVSFNRPYAASTNFDAAYGDAAYNVGAGEFLTNLLPVAEFYPTSSAGWDYNTVRWLEKEGYDVTYVTSIDLHASPIVRTRVHTYISSGHDEYWSWDMREHLSAFRDSGGNLVFFGANAMYWQVRLERSLVTGTDHRVMVAWKERYRNDPLFTDEKASNDHLVTSRWRDAPVSGPEDAVIGVRFLLQYVADDMVVSNAAHWVFGQTGLKNGSRLSGLLGFEVDGIAGNQPTGTEIL